MKPTMHPAEASKAYDSIVKTIRSGMVKLHMPPRPEAGMTMEIDGERFEIVEVTWTGGMVRVVLRKS